MKYVNYFCKLTPLLIALLVLLPAAYFIHISEYPFFKPETMFFLSIVTIIGGVVGLLIYVSHWAFRTVLMIALGLSMISFLPLEHAKTTPDFKEFSTTLSNENKRPIIHIILDDHLGIAAAEKGIAKPMENFFLDNGFMVYPKAYSHYADSYNAIPNALNLFPRAVDNMYFQGHGNKNILEQNSYFNYLTNLGYQFRIYQSSQIDFCQVPGVKYLSCYTYPLSSTKAIADTSLSSYQKFVYLSQKFLSSSMVVKFFQLAYDENLKFASQQLGSPESYYATSRGQTSPISAIQTFRELEDDIIHTSHDTVFFAHLLLPHGPYIYNEDCHVKPEVSQWYFQKPKSRISRQRRYDAYMPQLVCSQKILSKFFMNLKRVGIYKDAIIIIHGAHGAGIALHKPIMENRKHLTQQDFRDSFSTLFAIKAPSYKAQSNPKRRAVDYLLAKFIERINGERMPLKENLGYVYLPYRDIQQERLMVEVPLQSMSR